MVSVEPSDSATESVNEPPDITPGRRKWLVLSTVSIGTFMATLDGSIVNISLPKIQQAFGVNLTAIEWIVVAYLLVVGALLLPFGRLGDIIGYKRVYLLGFTLFAGASALCGSSNSVWVLVGFRALQGIGAAMLQAMGPAIVTNTFGARERGTALGLNSVSVSIGLSIGPALGGLLTEFGSWRWIFYVNVPIGIFAILWAWRILGNERGAGHQRFDSRGAILSSGGLFALLLALIQGESWGWDSPAVLALIAMSVLLILAFVFTELHSSQPMLDLRLFKIRPFTFGNISVLIAFAGLFIATFLMPFFLEQGQGFSPLKAGLLLTPIPLTTMIFAPFAGILSDRIGPRIPATLGIGVMALGLYTLTQLHSSSSYWALIWRLMIIGLGQGLFNSPN
ncbi:MAG TPA: DHA2 family efflux MFS transporter permease subunit, partial [Nitrolancea sp.]|nr:DHA2 family efflux MFS transporter permease subunit [Nitrolancea sp.]